MNALFLVARIESIYIHNFNGATYTPLLVVATLDAAKRYAEERLRSRAPRPIENMEWREITLDNNAYNTFPVGAHVLLFNTVGEARFGKRHYAAILPANAEGFFGPFKSEVDLD